MRAPATRRPTARSTCGLSSAARNCGPSTTWPRPGGETPLTFDSAGALLVGRGARCSRSTSCPDGSSVPSTPAAIPSYAWQPRQTRRWRSPAPAARCLSSVPELPEQSEDARCRQSSHDDRRHARRAAGRRAEEDRRRPARPRSADRARQVRPSVDLGSGFWDRPPLAYRRPATRSHSDATWSTGTPPLARSRKSWLGAQAEWMDAPRAVLALTPDGAHLSCRPPMDDMRDMALSSDQSRSIAAWSPARGRPEPLIKGPGALISAAAIPAAADVAVVAYYDHSVRVWELEASAGEELRRTTTRSAPSSSRTSLR